MKKIAILIEELFDEQELIYPYHRLREDYEVDLISAKEGNTYKSKVGFAMKSTKSSSEVHASDYVALYIPGGFSPDYMRRSEATKELVREFEKQGKPIAAICHGPWMLASCCDIQGEEITSTAPIKDDLIHAGANWVDKEVVISGNHITSRSPGDLPAHLKAFIKAIESN